MQNEIYSSQQLINLRNTMQNEMYSSQQLINLRNTMQNEMYSSQQLINLRNTMQNEMYSSQQLILHYYCRSCSFFNCHFILFNGLSVTYRLRERWYCEMNGEAKTPCPRHENVCRNGGITPLTLNMNVIWSCNIRVTPWPDEVIVKLDGTVLWSAFYPQN